MAGERIKLEVKERERVGSRESRRLRRDGYVPGVLYGRGMEPHAISVLERELRKALTGGSGLHAILDVVLEGQSTAHPSILKDYQQDPMRGKLVHIDLQEVRLDQPIQATVVVELKGGDDAPGVKEGGVLSQVVREVTVEALPMEVPEHLELDVSGMAIGDTLRLADLVARDGVKFIDDPETVLATVTLPTRVEEPEVEVEEGEEVAAAEGEEVPEGAAEGEAAPEAPAAEQGESGTTES
jgi:large subunit ribosomal protein L25